VMYVMAVTCEIELLFLILTLTLTLTELSYISNRFRIFNYQNNPVYEFIKTFFNNRKNIMILYSKTETIFANK